MKTIIDPTLIANATNKPWCIWIRPDLPYAAAVWTQEYAEARYKWNPLVVLAMNFGIRPVLRALEIWGHEVEVQAAVRFYGADETTYRASEAHAVSTRYKQFHGYGRGQVEKMMLAKRQDAIRFVSRHRDKIAEMKEKLG